jgi:antitoxin CptB
MSAQTTSASVYGSAAADPDGASAVALRRLRWHARRGLLENDLMLARFFDRHGASLDAGAVGALECLLALPDGELLDLALGRTQLQGTLDVAPMRAVLALLRAA